jgi:hypothetical protein
MVARTSCLFSSVTRNIVPARTAETTPSTSIGSSLLAFIIHSLLVHVDDEAFPADQGKGPLNGGVSRMSADREIGQSIAAAFTAPVTTAAIATGVIARAATATATGTFLARLGNIDGQSAAIHVFAVKGGNRRLGFLGRAHSDKSKTPRTACSAIHHQIRLNDRAVRGEHVLEIIFCDIEREVADEYFSAHK